MQYFLLIAMFFICSFTAETVPNKGESFDKKYRKVRLKDAKTHLNYVVNYLKEDGQLSPSAASGIKEIINQVNVWKPAISHIGINGILTENAQKILTRSLEETLGWLSKKVSICHDHASWQQEFLNAKHCAFEQRAMRAIVYEQTKAACINGFIFADAQAYQIPFEIIETMQKGAFVVDRMPPLDLLGPFQNLEVYVVEADTIDAAHRLCLSGYHPVALNFANQKKVGGGVIRGAQAQEEGLFRQSAYFLGLDISYNGHLHRQMNGRYFIPEFGAVYTPSVTVFRGPEEEGYPFIQPYQIDFIASAAYDFSKKSFSETPEYVHHTKEKIRTILRLSVTTGHDSVVLGAFGCGAFKNPADVVARLFSEVLLEDEFQGQFRAVVFAILNGDQDNKLMIFQNTLEHLITDFNSRRNQGICDIFDIKNSPEDL